jgi:molecular chaperone DnaK (HSP70)
MNADGILNVSATCSNASGVSKSLTITNDKNKLSAEEIDRMVKEAEQFKEEDEKFQQQRDAINMYESLLYTQKTNIPENKDNNDTIELIKKKIDEELQWISFNQQATKEEIDARMEQFQQFIKDNSVETPSPTPQETPSNPVVEEVD